MTLEQRSGFVSRNEDSERGDGADADEMRERIIEASKRLMSIYGSEKLSMTDVARAAKVSRATVYNYFQSKGRLLSAAETSLRAVFFDALSKAVAAVDTIEDKVAEIAVFIRQSWIDQRHTPWYGFLSPTDEAILVAKGSREHYRALIAFVAPLVDRAKENGEVRVDIDPVRAGEWIARLTLSFALSPADDAMNDPREIRRFFKGFLMSGLGRD